MPNALNIQTVCTAAAREKPRRHRPKPLATAITGIIGESPAMCEVFRSIERLASFPVTVLINGESGTGKELIAKALHRHSPRAGQPFIALNMAAIPSGLLESELFGHERGAFTGAHADHIGRFEQADGGTLFLDEIGDMPADLQTRLLRVLADGAFYPVGASSPRQVDVRILAATHQNLEALVAAGRFREDLFHRLNVIRLRVPPLRERREDIPLLLGHYLAEAARELREPGKMLAADTLSLLRSLYWPGNVRQLENLCRWIAVMVPGQTVYPSDLPPELSQAGLAAMQSAGALDEAWQASFRRWVDAQLETGTNPMASGAIKAAEKILIEAVLNATQGYRCLTAQRLGYSRNTLFRKMRELGVAHTHHPDDFREER